MMTVWRYKLALTDRVNVLMPAGARILTALLLITEPLPTKEVAIWALVDTEARKEVRTFLLFITGQPIPPTREMIFVNTVPVGFLELHIFEAKG